MKNKHGLPRNVPAEVKRILRKEAGFGCAKCGAAIYAYEHIDPEWADAKSHDADCMTLLCHQCNNKKKNRQLSAASVWEAKRNPFCTQLGYAAEDYDIGNGGIFLTFCSNVDVLPEMSHIIAGQPLFRFDSPEEQGAPIRINCKFSSAEGHDLFEIVDNEYKIGTENWDVEIRGPELTIRHSLGHIALRMKVFPPNCVVIDKIDLFHAGHRIVGDKNSYEIIGPNGSFARQGGNSVVGGGGFAHFENDEQEMRANNPAYDKHLRENE